MVRALMLAAVLGLALAVRGAAGEDGETPIERMMGAKLAADVERVLDENRVKSAAVLGFFSTDAEQNLAAGLNGPLPNELTRLLASALTNARSGGLNKYRVMPPTAMSRRKREAGLNVDNVETLPVLRRLLDADGERYDALLYGLVRKRSASGRTEALQLNLRLLKLEADRALPLDLEYEYRLEEGAGDRSSLAFLGENFPPLFVSRPSGERVNNPGGIFGPRSEVAAFIRVNGKRLKFYRSPSDPSANQAVVMLPFGAEYEIELFDRGGAGREKNRLFAAVLVDGLGVIGDWEAGAGGPDESRFLLCEDPAKARKWVLNGKGEETKDEFGAPGRSYFVRGWQSSQSAGRKFVFTRGADSLAAVSSQLSPNLGVVTIVFFEEDAGARGDYGTSMGREFSNRVAVVQGKHNPHPKYVVSIRCVPAGGGGAAAAEEPLMEVTR